MEDYRELLVKIDNVLFDGRFKSDNKIFRQISIALCEYVFDKMQIEQINALNVAKAFIDNTNTEPKRIRELSIISDRLDCSMKTQRNDNRDIDRLLFCSLDTNDGLSVIAGELLAELSESVGIPATSFELAFSRYVPAI